MRILRRQPFHRQVVIAACVLLLPLIAGIVFSARRTRAERQAEVRESAISVAVTAAAYLDESLRGLDALASGVLRHPAVIALDRSGCDALFKALVGEQTLLTNIALTDTRGMVRGTALALEDGPITLPWLTEVLTSGQPRVSNFMIGSVTGKPTVILAYPVEVNSSVAGVLGLTVDLTRLQRVFEQIPLPDGSVVEVFDHDNRMLVRTRDAERYVGQAVAPIDWAGLPRSAQRVGADGVERFSGDAETRRVPWVVSVGVPLSIVPARLAPLWQRNLTIAISALVGSLALLLWMSRQVSRHLAGLRSALRRVAAGDLSPPQIGQEPNLELSELQESVVEMAAHLREARLALDRQVEQERRMNDTLRSLQQQVVRQERLAAVGLLAAGLAHEINNPLQAIVGAAELLERGGLADSADADRIAAIKAQAGRAREIIRSLGQFGSQDSAPLEPISLADVVGEVVRLRARAADPAITIEVDVASRREVRASFAELAQVTLNFISNAQYAIASSPRKRGHIAIRVHDVGRRVRLEVEDDGPGVPPVDESKLFQPFFTTRPVGDGSGLGLSVSYGLIQSFGGTIGYARNHRGGATFFFELSAVESAAPDADDRQAVLQRPV